MGAAADRLRAFLRAYAAKDLAAIEPMVAEGARLQDWNLAVEGKARVLEETQRNFDAAQTIDIDVLRVHESDAPDGGTCAAAELRIVVDGTIELFVVDAVAFDRSGLVTSIRAYKG
jgi:hypothetical protein